MDKDKSYPVALYIYDLDVFGFAKRILRFVLGREFEVNGIWHTSIVVHEIEFFYGITGIECVIPPSSTILGTPLEVVHVGTTNISLPMLEQHLNELEKTRYCGRNYHLLWHNCNTFSNEIILFLSPQSYGVPQYILDLPARVHTNLSIAKYLITDQREYMETNSNAEIDFASNRKASPESSEMICRDLVEEIIEQSVNRSYFKQMKASSGTRRISLIIENMPIANTGCLAKCQDTLIPRTIAEIIRAAYLSNAKLGFKILQESYNSYPNLITILTGILCAMVTYLYIDSVQKALENIPWISSVVKLIYNLYIIENMTLYRFLRV